MNVHAKKWESRDQVQSVFRIKRDLITKNCLGTNKRYETMRPESNLSFNKPFFLNCLMWIYILFLDPKEKTREITFDFIKIFETGQKVDDIK